MTSRRPTPADDDPLALLGGGDLRSIGRANEVVALVLARPPLFDRLVEGMRGDDPIIRARSADVAEKVSARQPAWLQPHKRVLVHELVHQPQPEVRWHVALMLARLTLDDDERVGVFRQLIGWLNDDSRIVKTNSMQALADLAQRHPSLKAPVLQHVRALSLTGTPAMRARGRRLLKSLQG